MLDSIGKPCTHDLVYDGTMNKAKKYLPLVDRLKKMGYEVLVIYMQVPKKVSMERVMERYQRTGRYVPYHVINEVYENGLEAYEEVIKAADGYIRVDGVTGKIIDKGGKPIPKERNYEDGSVSMKNHSSTGLAKGIAPGLYVKGKGGKKYNVNSLEELSAMWREVVNRELNLHARDTRMVEREIEIYNSKDEVVGRVSQNGKVWLGAHDGSSYDSNGKFQYTSPPLVYDPYAKEEEPCCEGCDKKDGSGCDEPKVTSPWVLLARARVQRVRILNLADSK
jgi:predicted peroxiredoxin